MTIRTQLKAGRMGGWTNHNEALVIRSSVKAGRMGWTTNHNDALEVRTSLKGGRKAMRRAVLTTVRKEDRLELMVVRAGLRAGKRRSF